MFFSSPRLGAHSVTKGREDGKVRVGPPPSTTPTDCVSVYWQDLQPLRQAPRIYRPAEPSVDQLAAANRLLLTSNRQSLQKLEALEATLDLKEKALERKVQALDSRYRTQQQQTASPQRVTWEETASPASRCSSTHLGSLPAASPRTARVGLAAPTPVPTEPRHLNAPPPAQRVLTLQEVCSAVGDDMADLQARIIPERFTTGYAPHEREEPRPLPAAPAPASGSSQWHADQWLAQKKARGGAMSPPAPEEVATRAVPMPPLGEACARVSPSRHRALGSVSGRGRI